jgi:hypothetical protein|tara:strand:+ start:200 stop:847 length:648 start_codon:yes stop_codon:yes gene_type:complete
MLAEKETIIMANTTFSGPVRSEGGFTVVDKNSSTGAMTTVSSVNSTGQLWSMGSRKIQSFAGTLASTDAATTAYGDGDVLVELGTLNTDLPGNLVTGSKFFIHRALIGITTAAGQTLVGGLSLSATSGTSTNSAVSSGTEIVGAGVTSFNEQLSATQSITEVDVNFNNTAGNYHIFVPNVTAAVASKYLYAFATTAVNADITAGRFTVELEYSVY